VKTAFILSGLVLISSGCAGLTAVKGGADAAKGAADEAKGQKDSAQAAVKDEKDKAKGDKGGGGGGGPAGPTRLEAGDGDTNQAISDKIDFKKGKVNDWRKFQLVGKPGYATFELHWDDESANLTLDVFDKFGVNIGKSPRRIEGQSSRKILLRIDDPGLYYVRVAGPTKSDSSIYTVFVKWDGPPKPVADNSAPPPAPNPNTNPNAPPAPNPNTTAPPAPCPPGQVCPPPCPQGQVCPDPNKVYGSIVQLVREGSTVTLYLDKGSTDKLRAGMSGTILDGPEGDKPFEGGTFSIAQVIGSNKSIAKSTTLSKSLGKNKRIVINLK
jgi:hypothetical protein